MNPTELHEYKRIQSMTDDELCTRYGKMNKEDKIEAFYKVLKQEGRAKKLQTQIASDKGYDLMNKNKSKKKTRKKGSIKKVYTGSTRPKEVYALRSSEEHDDAGVWVKVFMCYNANTVMMVEFENGEIVNTENFTYSYAREYWNKQVSTRVNMHRDDSYIEGLDLGDVRI